MLGFVSGLAREIIKSVQDVEGDVAARGSRTLPVLVGRKAALIGAAALYAFFIPLAFVPFAAGLPPEPAALALVALGDVIIASVIYRILREPEQSFGYARNASLAAFALGMLGFLAAAL
jgi:4-hydroxybenzoate polyprenyltransferase